MMIRLQTIILSAILLVANSKSDFLTPQEFQISASLANHFHISYCIYVLSDSIQKFWPISNDTMEINFFISVWTIKQLNEFFIKMETEENRSGRSMIILKSDESSLNVLREVSQRSSLSPLTWLIYSDKPVNSAEFDGIYIPFDCVFIHISQRGEIYLLTELYRIERSSGIETTNFGFWSKDNGLSTREELLYRRRKTLNFHSFLGAIGSEPPYIIQKGFSNSGNEFGGYFYEVWKELEQRIKFRTELSRQDEGKKFRFDDMQNVEFAVTPITYSSSTLDLMDITHPIYESRAYLFGHRPGSELEWDSYLKPFDTQTWWATLAWMACSSTALAIMYKIAWNYGTSETEAEYFKFTFAESFATVFRAMCMQGSDVTPISSSCRLLFLSIYLTALVVSSAFSAALFSLLTIPTARAPFSSFEQVISDKAFKIGVIKSSEIHEILKEYTSKYPNSIQDKLLGKTEGDRNGNPNTLLEGLNFVCNRKKYVIMSELPYVLYTMQNLTRDCQEKVMPSGPILLKSFLGFGMKKGSPYKEIINIHILMMRNDGVIRRLLLNNWPPGIPSVQTTWVRVTLADISPILYMFSLGVVSAIVFLIIEKIYYHIFRRNRSEGKKNFSKNGASLIKTFTNFH